MHRPTQARDGMASVAAGRVIALTEHHAGPSRNRIHQSTDGRNADGLGASVRPYRHHRAKCGITSRPSSSTLRMASSGAMSPKLMSHMK
jgi:hypothetical protein